MTEDTSNTPQEKDGVFVTVIETALVEIGKERYMFVDGVWVTENTIIKEPDKINSLFDLLIPRLKSGQYTRYSFKEVNK